MLSGVKFVPRDQLQSVGGSSDGSELSLEDSKASKNGKGRHKGNSKRRKSFTEDQDGKESMIGTEINSQNEKKKNKKKTKYSSDEYDDYSSEYSSESLVDIDRETHGRRDRKPRKGCRSSSSLEEDRSHGRKERRGKKKEDRGNMAQDNDNMVRRKEMGLDWMSMPVKNKDDQLAHDSGIMLEHHTEDAKLANPKELNPYLRDNGTGYPDDVSPVEGSKRPLLASSLVGDGGASWRLKALKRAREQAIREGKKVEEIVEERWGSVGQLAVPLASQRAAPANAHLRAISHRKRGQTEAYETNVDEINEERDVQRSHDGRKAYLFDVSSRHPEMRKPKNETFARRKARNNHSSEDSLLSEAISSINKYANDGSFMDAITDHQKVEAVSKSSHITTGESMNNKAESSETTFSNKEPSDISKGLSSNQLAAKALQLRLKGKHEEAENLLKEMEDMRTRKEIGVQTDIYPIKGSTRQERRGLSEQLMTNEEDADRHLAQKIMKNKQYSMSRRADDEYDFDDEAPVKKRNHNKHTRLSAEQNRIPDRLVTQKERCQFCFDNPKRQKHLVVSIGQFTYMMLPHWQPVVEGHCCISPLEHESSTRSVDDNVWEELRNFKKCLLMMFAKEEKSVMFLETVVGLAKQQRHCLVECIPLPRDLANEAPLYFKKAIDEAEDEWSQHNSKKLIYTTREKGLRRSIPKDFPYFHVEFGLDEGFVHVIDDEGKFNSSLGLNVIRGMLKLSEEDMYRRRRNESLENQQRAVAAFAKAWDLFDWTKQLRGNTMNASSFV